jgi:hypothetical protein
MAVNPATTTADPAKWFDKFPTPKSSPETLSVERLHELLQSKESHKVIVVDVRRTDIEVRYLSVTIYYTHLQFRFQVRLSNRIHYRS